MPSTSVPCASSSSASDPPKRPSPMTTTESACAADSGEREKKFLANEGPFLRVFVEKRAFAERQSGAQRHRAEAADEHEQDQDHLAGRRQGGGDAGGEPHRGERGDHLEQDA